MFRYLPQTTKNEFASNDEEAQRWVNATINGLGTDARRPPELSTRDNVSRAIYTEVKEGRGSEHGGVFLDISYQKPEHIKKKLPSMYHQFKDLADVDITAGPMEVGPTMHYIMGGIRVDADTAQSKVPGLFAAGEVTGGMHGANRLGGNSLSDLVVFGRRAGAGAAQYAKQLAESPKVHEDQIQQAIEELEKPLRQGKGINPYDLHKQLNQVMSTYVGIFREEADLLTGLAKLAELKTQLQKLEAKGSKLYNPGWHLCRDLKNMLICSEAIARSALMRKESRGAHSRIDYPSMDPKFAKLNISVYNEAGEMKLAQTPLPEMPPELKELFAKKEPACA